MRRIHTRILKASEQKTSIIVLPYSPEHPRVGTDSGSRGSLIG
jgi:hypothetical protein